jgi:hypothetical protein
MKAEKKQNQVARRLIRSALGPNVYRCRIDQQPNGFPVVGDYVDQNEYPYRVVAATGVVFTGGRGDKYIFATVERVSWLDVPEGSDVWPCEVEVSL